MEKKKKKKKKKLPELDSTLLQRQKAGTGEVYLNDLRPDAPRGS